MYSSIFISLLLLALPVILASIIHMLVVKWDWFKKIKFPLDHYLTFRGKRVFGDHKTYRGLFVMIIASIIFTYLYSLCQDYPFFQRYNLLDFNQHGPLFFGFLYGFGYILGELPNSFVKRQLNIKPGEMSFRLQALVDQFDSVICILLLLLIFSDFSILHFAIGTLFYGFLHLAINYLLFMMKIRKQPF